MMLVPCTVESVRVHVLTNQHVVLLQAQGVRRLLPIWIGPDQAYSIATRIAGITSERPLTHDLMVDMLGKVGAEVTRVVVKDLVADDQGGGVFHGSVFLQLKRSRSPSAARPASSSPRAFSTAPRSRRNRTMIRSSPSSSSSSNRCLTSSSRRSRAEAQLARPDQKRARSTKRSRIARATTRGVAPFSSPAVRGKCRTPT